MAKMRCSNCEKSVMCREDNGIVVENDRCKATGEEISGEKYFKTRECDEFLARIEYSQQFRTVFDKVMKGLATGKAIKDIVR